MTGTPGGTPILYLVLLLPTITIGVGNGMKPPQYLTRDTVMEVIVSKIGTLRNEVAFD